MANIFGSYPEIERVETGLWSLDRALSGNGNKGIPMTIVEIFGFQGIGKTTTATSLASIVSNHYESGIVYVPFEHVDRKLMGKQLDYHGCKQELILLGDTNTVKRFFPSQKVSKEDITDEFLLDCFLASIKSTDYCVGVVDSLSAVYTIGEAGSSVADRNMGKARVVSNFTRGIPHAYRMRGYDESPYLSILLSHKTVPMGGGTPTNTGAPTTGGEVKKNIAKVRIGLRRLQEPSFSMNSKKEIYEEHAYILEGKVEKNNFGREGKTFFIAMLGGKGAHTGLTAMYECKRLGIASFGKSVTLGKEKFGSISTMLDKAHSGDDEAFQPFIDALNSPSSYEKAETQDSEEDAEIFIEDELPE